MGNLETGFASGLDASGRKLGFYSLPESKTFESGVTVAEALELSGMNFQVAKKPVFRQDREGNFIEVPGQFEHYRTDNDRHLGVIGNQNTAFQNEAAFAMVDELLGFGVEIRSAGTWNGGADVFISAQVPNGIHVEGVMDADLYLLFRNNHAGKGAVSGLISPVDIRCTNMIGSATNKAVTAWKCRHTRTVGDRVQEASIALRLVDEFKESMEAAARKLSEAEMSLEEVENFIKEWEPTKERVQKSVMDTYTQSENLTQGNAWGVYSAVTEALDWNSPRRTGIETRFASQLSGPIASSRQRAMNMLLRAR